MNKRPLHFPITCACSFHSVEEWGKAGKNGHFSRGWRKPHEYTHTNLCSGQCWRKTTLHFYATVMMIILSLGGGGHSSKRVYFLFSLLSNFVNVREERKCWNMQHHFQATAFTPLLMAVVRRNSCFGSHAFSTQSLVGSNFPMLPLATSFLYLGVKMEAHRPDGHDVRNVSCQCFHFLLAWLVTSSKHN